MSKLPQATLYASNLEMEKSSDPNGRIDPVSPHKLIIVMDEDWSKTSLVFAHPVESVPYRSTRYWCTRFVSLVLLVSALQIAFVLLLPAFHRLLDSSQAGTVEKYAATADIAGIFMAVKTTKRFHSTRLKLLLDTWINQAKHQTFVFTDAEDESTRRRLKAQSDRFDIDIDDDDHFVVTDCPPDHSRAALSCKMAREFEAYYKSKRNHGWFCHFDDDTYVNVINLAKLLKGYDHQSEWYLGRPSLNEPFKFKFNDRNIEFTFATGGAGFCLSEALMKKLEVFISNGKFEQISTKTGLPDDCTVGYIVEAVANVKLTVVPTMHSHLEFLAVEVTQENIAQQVTFSYSTLTDRREDSVKVHNNIVGIRESPKLSVNDPTRLLSSHCLLFPSLCRWH